MASYRPDVHRKTFQYVCGSRCYGTGNRKLLLGAPGAEQAYRAVIASGHAGYAPNAWCTLRTLYQQNRALDQAVAARVACVQRRGVAPSRVSVETAVQEC